VRRKRLEILQVNVGYRCNQSCVHCHVNAGPQRTEMMSPQVVEEVVAFLPQVETLDITGGAPELHPQFRSLVSRARQLDKHVIDRCNLTILQEPGQADLARFLAGERVEIIASLPCYTPELVDRQRGAGVYERSIAALRELNALGYGSDLPLNLVYNPQGPTLPPAQDKLEADYRRELGERHGVRFNRLYTLANMPIQRFGSTLVSKGQFAPYMELLRRSHREENLEAVMCRNLVSVDWQGYVYDCDFNQMLGVPLGGRRTRLAGLVARELPGAGIAVRDHCFGCTAGQGSSCGGALHA
jgi:radical SAM/Cys-rich protein